jgi:LysM repeat protein
MEVKVLKNIVHQGVQHSAGAIIDLINADIERLIGSGHITDKVTEEDRKTVASGQPASVPPAQQQSQEQQAQAASPAPAQPEAPATPADTTTQENSPANTPTDQTQTASTQPDNTHTVVEGETLASIAETFGITVEELAEANGIPASSVPEVGVVLKVPTEQDNADEENTETTPANTPTE